MNQENGFPPPRPAPAQNRTHAQEPAPSLKRRALFKRVGQLGTLGFALSLGVVERARAKAAKSEFLYQDQPRDGKDCAQCKFFTPENGQADSGSCAIVSGVIRGSGWCLGYSPRA